MATHHEARRAPRTSLLAIGGSLGSFTALTTVLPALGRAPSSRPVLIVVHREPGKEDALTTLLQAYCAVPVAEIVHRTTIASGCVYLAPADYHVLIDHDAFALSVDEPVEYARPSIDVCFESVARRYGAGAIGVLLTGRGRDGAAGLGAIRRHGGRTVVQDPAGAGAEAPDMLLAAINAGAADHIVPLAGLGAFLAKAAE